MSQFVSGTFDRCWPDPDELKSLLHNRSDGVYSLKLRKKASNGTEHPFEALQSRWEAAWDFKAPGKPEKGEVGGFENVLLWSTKHWSRVSDNEYAEHQQLIGHSPTPGFGSAIDAESVGKKTSDMLEARMEIDDLLGEGTTGSESRRREWLKIEKGLVIEILQGKNGTSNARSRLIFASYNGAARMKPAGIDCQKFKDEVQCAAKSVQGETNISLDVEAYKAGPTEPGGVVGSDYFIIATGQQSKTSYQHLMATGNSCMYDGNTRNPLGVLEFEQLMVSVLTGAPSSVGAGNLIKRISHMFSHISSGKTSNAPTSIESSISEWGAPDTESTSPLTQNTERLVQCVDASQRRDHHQEATVQLSINCFIPVLRLRRQGREKWDGAKHTDQQMHSEVFDTEIFPRVVDRLGLDCKNLQEWMANQTIPGICGERNGGLAIDGLFRERTKQYYCIIHVRGNDEEVLMYAGASSNSHNYGTDAWRELRRTCLPHSCIFKGSQGGRWLIDCITHWIRLAGLIYSPDDDETCWDCCVGGTLTMCDFPGCKSGWCKDCVQDTCRDDESYKCRLCVEPASEPQEQSSSISESSGDSHGRDPSYAPTESDTKSSFDTRSLRMALEDSQNEVISPKNAVVVEDMTRDKLNYVPGSFEDIGEEPLPSQVVPDQPDEDGQPEQREPASTIYEAAAQGNLELVQAFMEEGWDTRSLDESGMAPLHYAARGGHHEIVTCLLRDGNAHIDQYSIRNNRQSSTALHFAAEAGKKSVVHRLLHRGAKVEARQNDLVNGPTALHLAAYRNHIDVVKLLCGDKRAPTTMRAQFPDPDKWRTPLEVARDELHHEIVEIIRAQGG